MLSNHSIHYHKQPESFLPMEVEPLKNPFCPHYGECLDLAIQEKWPQFTCSKCDFKNLQEPVENSFREVEGCYQLLKKVFMVN